MGLLIIGILILVNGLFSMSEIALVSAKRFKLDAAAKKGNKSAAMALNLADKPGRFLSAVQIGITLISILIGVFSSEDMQVALQEKLEQVSFLAEYADTIAPIVVVFIVTFVTIVFGELIPKRIGLIFPEKIAMLVAPPMQVISFITAPFVWLLVSTNKLFLWMLGIKTTDRQVVTEEEIKAMIEESAEHGDVQEIEHVIVDRAFALGDRNIKDIMTNRREVVWLDINEEGREMRKRINNDIHSFYPVGDGDLDKLLGVVSLKKLFAANAGDTVPDLYKYLKKPLILHENTLAYNALEQYRTSGIHFAIVVDEYGSIVGVVTMDDMLDALVGDVSEESVKDQKIKQSEDGTWLVDGRYPYFELVQYFKLEDEEQVKNNEFNTVSGLILHRLGRMPKEGEIIQWHDYELKVVDKDGLRIDKIEVTYIKNDEEVNVD